MVTVDLDTARGLTASIWIDLMDYAFPANGDIGGMGLSEEQLKFARTEVMADQYLNTYTTLFYRYCSMRIPQYIPKTFAKVVSAKYPYTTMELTYEDAFDLPPVKQFDARSHIPLTPDAVVVSFPVNLDNHERVIVHRNLTNNKRMVQYRSARESAFVLFQRFGKLQQPQQSIVVTNQSIRTMLKISV